MKIRWRRVVIILGVLGVFLAVIYTQNNSKKEIKKFTGFFNASVEPKYEKNEVKEMIAQKIGAECQELWLTGAQSSEDAFASYIATGEYPDFISGNITLYNAGALIPLDEHWEDYPNIRNYLSDEEWDLFRQEDGHIYWIPQFGVVNGEYKETLHEGEAFWIQTRVLKWAGYPEIHTVDEYFKLIEEYMKANPYMETGESNIPFTILCDDWRFFCMENPPQFLDGYPNDGCCIVEPDTAKVIDYNTTNTAKRYYEILNREYHNGIIDPESFTQCYGEYLNKISTGRVLGFVDQWWQFAYDTNDTLSKLSDVGCNYVPLPITIDEGIQNKWHVRRGNEITIASGTAITVSCKDLKGALKFMNDLLDDDIQKLRNWGVEGVDYEVDENGEFYRTKEQRERADDTDYDLSHFCSYSYFPRNEGMSTDGINAFSPEYQYREFRASLPTDVIDCFQAYNCETYVDMIGSNDEPGAWYPMYSYTDMISGDSEIGRIRSAIWDLKHEYLPQIVMTDDFESMWTQYMNLYQECEPGLFLDDLQKEVDRRVSNSKRISKDRSVN